MIIHGLGGEIGYRSSFGKGSTFYFRLKLKPCKYLSNNSSSITSSGITGRFNYQTPLKILLAEDNTINRTVIATVLKRMGHIVVEAENGLEASEKFLQETFDLVLMDMQMPIMDGCAATQEIREINQSIPIIALTADVLASSNKKYQEVGITAFATKPVDWQKLEDVIEQNVS